MDLYNGARIFLCSFFFFLTEMRSEYCELVSEASGRIFLVPLGVSSVQFSRSVISNSL